MFEQSRNLRDLSDRLKRKMNSNNGGNGGGRDADDGAGNRGHEGTTAGVECKVSFEIHHGKETTHFLTFTNIKQMPTSFLWSGQVHGDVEVDQYEDDGKCLVVPADKVSDDLCSGISSTSFIIGLDGGSWWKPNSFELPPRPRSNFDAFLKHRAQPRLRIFMKMYGKKLKPSSSSEMDGTRAGPQYRSWWSLNVEQLGGSAADHIVKYKFKVEASLDQGPGQDGNGDRIHFEAGAEFIPGGDLTTVLKKRIAQLDDDFTAQGWRDNVFVASTTTIGYHPGGNLLLKISVTPSSISARCDGHPRSCSCENNYTDIKLETRDKIIFNANKSRLITRSPYLASLIKERPDWEGFHGTVKLEQVTSQTLNLILPWIDTGRLPPNWGDSADELVEVADKFGLEDLTQFVNTNLGGVCNPDNMVRLYRVVQRRKNQLPQAFADISRFVKRELQMN